MIKQARNPDSFLPEFISISSSTVSKAVSWGCDNRTWVITWILTNSNEKALDVESAMNPATEQSTFICLASSTSSRSYLLQLHLKKIWFLIKHCVFIRYKLLSFVLGCFGFFFRNQTCKKHHKNTKTSTSNYWAFQTIISSSHFCILWLCAYLSILDFSIYWFSHILQCT